ncbi:MAG TPA: hypothetical protein VFZ65_12025, partial [Planctomycetota bacterium]|nr:hypothetical protein [Planctomycetota bacterium]
MDPAEAPTTTVSTQRDFRAWLRDMPRWKKVSLAVAIGTTVIGGILTLAHSGSTPTGTAENPLTTNFA